MTTLYIEKKENIMLCKNITLQHEAFIVLTINLC